jgi:hypothetical protein
MSEDTDRIPVPTNGKGPHRDTLEAATTPAPKPPSAPAGRTKATPVGEAPDDAAADGGAVPREQTIAFTPNQLAAGFGIVAGLLLLFAARRRRGRG